MTDRYSFEDFMEIVKKLRAPDGCPWDRAQTHETLNPCLINETAEVLAAVEVLRETGDGANLCEELGDVLLLVLLQSLIAQEEGLFDFSDVVQTVSEKMIRRHPHVFGQARDLPDWEEIKRAEKAAVPREIEDAKKRALQNACQDMIIHIGKQKK